MSSSGVRVAPECQAEFQRIAKDLRYIIFKIEDREVVVEHAVPHSEITAEGDSYSDNSKGAYEQFANEIKSITNDFADCRYAVFDFKFLVSRDGAGASKMDKIVFIQLCPDGASIKKKMLYASSASAIKASLGTGQILQFQVSDESEMSHRELHGKLVDKYSDKHRAV